MLEATIERGRAPPSGAPAAPEVPPPSGAPAAPEVPPLSGAPAAPEVPPPSGAPAAPEVPPPSGAPAAGLDPEARRQWSRETSTESFKEMKKIARLLRKLVSDRELSNAARQAPRGPDRQSGLRGGGGRCYECGERGHFSRDCPRLRQQGVGQPYVAAGRNWPTYTEAARRPGPRPDGFAGPPENESREPEPAAGQVQGNL
ncbi:PREDICTED: oleosin-B6-like [Priapulus caudatus]|uniref:Oleosin-B6-like n=1 Tax=Priapulus caudatus TaxID=37621 RepID=A0ABM1F1Z0_PRICU|nr:PREDICTED: oleosin-B6-like [Priapulus caudatus]